jgi:hypothetical protein
VPPHGEESPTIDTFARVHGHATPSRDCGPKRRSRSRGLAAIAILLAIVGAAPIAAQQVDVIRGRITDPAGAPVERARIVATSLTGEVNRTATADANGRFTITFPNGEGDYTVTVSAVGYTQKRFEVKRTADQDILVADAQLTRMTARLDSVVVHGRRDKVGRDDRAPDIGGTEQRVTPSAVAANDLGDLAAMAASVPGVTLVPGSDGDPSGFSVLGLTPDQNNATLNGQAFDGSSIPRDAGVMTSLVTSPYDVSRGGFSGAQLSIRTTPATNFITRTMSLNIDAPQLQWTDPAGRALGQRYSNMSLGGALTGPIEQDASFYSLSYQLGRRASDLQTLLNTNTLGLRTAGIAADSVAQLLSILAQSGIPTSANAVPAQRTTDQGNLLASIDIAPPSSKSGSAYNLTVNGAWTRLAPVTVGATDLAAHGGDRTSARGGLQARHSAYFGVGILTETTLGVSASHSSGSPYLSLPSGTVRVASSFADGSDGVKLVSFGGNSFLGTAQSSTSASFDNTLSWFSENNKHRLKLATELRRDGFSQDESTNVLGSFTFNSLADLQAGAPASFTRTLTPRTRSGSETIGAISLGDSYRRTSTLQLQYGVRLDGNAFNGGIAPNPAVEQIFGTRNDRTPNHFYVSPRLGFSWQYGTAPQVAGFAGAVRGPRAVVRGGIGVFQNIPASTLLAGAMDNTGLPSAVQQITCIGTAVPTPDWSAYVAETNAIPTQCADGTLGPSFATRAPSVALFAPDYQPTRSLRSNLQWSGAVLDGRFSTTVDGTYSRNMEQPSVVDLNFDPTTRFRLADEGGRPVYAQLTEIDPVTGLVAPAAARVTSQFSHVSETRSDLRSVSKQLTLSLSPARFSTNYRWAVAYVLSDVREQVRGFTSTAGNPFDVTWGRAATSPRHQLQYTLSYNFLDAVRMSWFGTVRSGTPYTPMVAGDVNGDGFANDRAFIFDPAHTADTALGSAMRALLGSAPASVRSCLERQIGKIAQRNSCDGAWATTALFTLALNPVKFRLPRRANLSLQISNPLGAADLLVHGESHLHGWGQQAFPDASLLYVRGFDAQAQRFTYSVNQRFGSSSTAFSTIRAPVTVTAMMRFDLGPTRERQTLTQQLDRGRTRAGDRPSALLLKLMYGTGGLPNPMVSLLREADTLHFTATQADSIATLNRAYTMKIDSIWDPVTKALAALPDKYDHDAAYARYITAREATVDLLIRIAPELEHLLTPEQRRRLPPTIASYLDPRYLASIRSGTFGTAANNGVFMLNMR